MDISVEGLGGLDEVEAALNNANRTVHRRTVEVIRKHGQMTGTLGRANAPVLTGATKASIGTDYGDGGLSATTGPTTSWAIFPERGTSRQPPQRYMGRAADTVEPKFIAACEDVADIHL